MDPEVKPTGTPPSNAPEPKLDLKAQVQEVLKAELQPLQTQLAASQKLLDDPDVKALLELKQSGKEVAVGEKTVEDPLAALFELPAGAGEPEAPSLDTLTNEDILKRVGGAVDGAMARAMEPMTARLDAMDARTEKDEQDASDKRLSTEIVDALKTHPDFKEYQTEIGQLYDSVASGRQLSVNDLYLLAKVKKVGLPKPAVDTERPLNLLPRTPGGGNKREVRQGRRGFQDIVRDAASKFVT